VVVDTGGAGATGTSGTLYLVSTPIGNMSDLTLRAVEILGAVSAVLAEDTRHSRPLLQKHGIPTPLVAYHEHNEAKTTPTLVARLAAGESFALISDAGTPLLSDPGARLVRAAIDAGIPVSPIPGASALLAALVASGIVADRFTFFGFLARKGKERTETIREIAELTHTAVIYEAPARVGETLAALAKAGAGSRETCVARELTKQFEEFRRGTVQSLAESYKETAPRGEVVLVVAGAETPEPDEATLRDRAHALRAEGLSARDVARVLTEESHAPRNLAYRLAHE
jgi:16S rRNA (cytidine1402-2'-O)-methyltransferase